MTAESENPYASPRTPVYYSDDITRLPFRVILGTLLQLDMNPVLKSAVFLFISLRKILRIRFAPSYGIPEPEQITKVAWDSIPIVTRQAIERRVTECQAAGMQLAFCATTPHIGGRTAFTVAFLNVDGRICATVQWIRTVLSTKTNENVLFVCHTDLKCGKHLHTGAAVIPSLGVGFEDDDVLSLPPETTVRDVLAQHERRVSAFDSNEIILHTPAELFSDTIVNARRIFDKAVFLGLFFQLSEGDIKRLSSTTT